MSVIFRTFCFVVAGLILLGVWVGTCSAQYLPYGYGYPYGGWGAAQTMAAAQRQTAVYNNYKANERQAIRTNALQHYNTNQFLMQRSQSMSLPTETRQSSMDWMMQRQPTTLPW